MEGENAIRYVLDSLKYMVYEKNKPAKDPEHLKSVLYATTMYIDCDFNTEEEYYTCLAVIHGWKSINFLKKLRSKGYISSYSDDIVKNAISKLKSKYNNVDIESSYTYIFKFLDNHGLYSIHHFVDIIKYTIFSSVIKEDLITKCMACLYLSGKSYYKEGIIHDDKSIKETAAKTLNIKNHVYNNTLSKDMFDKLVNRLINYDAFNVWVYIYQDLDDPSFKIDKFESIDTDIKNFSKYDPKKCRVMNKIRKLKILGSGSFGSVYEVEVPNIGPRKYALKMQSDDFDDQITKENKENKEMYVLENNNLLEFLIGRVLASSYENGECINFFSVYSYASCEQKPLATRKNPKNIYILMDKISGSFSDGASCIESTEYITKIEDDELYTNISDNTFIQLLFSIAFYQDKWKISHNDLHQDNIFLEYINKDTEYKGQKLIDVDYFHYRVKGKDIYMNASPVIVKIGDLGYSIKYSEPRLVSLSYYEQRYQQDIIAKGWGKGDLDFEAIPLTYIPQYDSFFASTCFCNLIQTDFIESAFSYLTNRTYAEFIFDPVFRPYENYKPILDLESLPTALDFFTNEKLLNKYNFLTKPEHGKIITLGEIK